MSIPLSVLALTPIPAGSTAAEALRNTVDLARQAERQGCRRFRPAEHHLDPGVAGASPPLAIAALAALVADRQATRFVGSPETFAERPAALAGVTGADELLVTTITHRHADRVDCQTLLAREWAAGS